MTYMTKRMRCTSLGLRFYPQDRRGQAGPPLVQILLGGDSVWISEALCKLKTEQFGSRRKRRSDECGEGEPGTFADEFKL